MTYKVAICDDNEADLKYIGSLAVQWASSTNTQIYIDSFPSAEAFLFHYEEQKDYDILLLDIEMNKMDGVTLAKVVRKENEWVQIVFVTGYSDYIAEGYEVSALHYLVKPVQKEKLFEVLSRATTKLKKNEGILNLEMPDELVRLPLYEISYLEVRQNYVTIHGKKDYTLKKPLKEFEAKLDDRFFRVGRSYMINLEYIEKITKKDVFLSEGSVIPLPRGSYEPLNRAIIMHR